MPSTDDLLDKARALARTDKPTAEGLYRQVLAAYYNDASIFHEFGLFLLENEKFEEGASYLSRSTAVAPMDATSWYNRAIGHVYCGDYQKGFHCLQEALRLSPMYPQANWSLGNWLLGAFQFEQGWLGYEWGRVTGNRPTRHLLAPWNGRPIPGQTLFIHAEQGLGDFMIFSRFLRAAKERSQAHIVLECDSALLCLFHDNPYVDQVITRKLDCSSTSQNYTNYCSIMSLPFILGINDPSKLWNGPYITPHYGILVEASENPKKCIGICWAGKSTFPEDRWRSLTPEQFAPIVNVPGFDFISLHPSDEEFGGKVSRIALNNMDTTAAVIATLDLVITTCTAVAHLAGAMGKATWLLAGKKCYWCWGRDVSVSPWYPNTHIFRQQTFGDWDTVIANVVTTLETINQNDTSTNTE